MSNISLNNYEAYLLDYFEGNLTENAIAELKTFLLLHPELNIDLEGIDLPYFSKDSEVINFKDSLIKTEEDFDLADAGISKSEIDAINYLEGNLSGLEIINFENRLKKNTELAKDLAALKKSVLIVDSENKFENKNELIKTEDDLVLNNTSLMYAEGLLIGEEKEEFERLIKINSNLAAELHAFERTKMLADFSIIHPDKESLIKQAKVIVFFTTRNVMTIAAAILLILGLTVLFNTIHSNPELKKEKAEIKRSESTIMPIEQNKNQIVITNKEKENLNKNLAAKANNIKNKEVIVRNDTILIKREESNYIAENEIKSNALEVINKKDSILTVAVKTNSVESKLKEVAYSSKQTVLLAVEESDNDDAVNADEPKSKNGFWKRAVKLAKQVNGLGIKAVNGDEKANEDYLISFNGFSVEKK